MADLLEKYLSLVPGNKITLRSARTNQQLSLEAVADVLSVCGETIQQYEYDSRQIPFDDAMKLFKLYGVTSVNVFMGIDTDGKAPD